MKKIWCLLLIFAVLLSALVACDTTQNDPNPTPEHTVESTESMTENAPSNDNTLSYDDIITMFRQIVNLYPSYTEEKMLANTCDGMDAIHDEETRELYKKLFISGYRFYLRDYAHQYHADGRNYFGYTVTDINKNGSEELILLTDHYDIIAILSMAENQPKLLLDNYEDVYHYCRMDEQGNIYTQHFESSNDYTLIYSLDECDNLVLDEKNLTSVWRYGNFAGIMTKNRAKLTFTRLFGELPLYLPDIYSWDWSSNQFNDNENVLFISNLTDRTVSIALYDTPLGSYREKASINATLNGNIATFDTEKISGRLEFGLDSVWLIIDESNISGLPCGAFIYTELSYSKG